MVKGDGGAKSNGLGHTKKTPPNNNLYKQDVFIFFRSIGECAYIVGIVKPEK